jgi:hypothetical protein
MQGQVWIFFGGNQRSVFLLYVQHFTQQGILILEPSQKKTTSILP